MSNSNASERSESAISHSWDLVEFVLIVVGGSFQGIIHRHFTYGNLVLRVAR
jgi:hypothetical protein